MNAETLNWLLAAHALGLVLFAVCIGPLTQSFKIQRG